MPHLVTTSVDEAARALRSGGLVAFATETVYGLGALASDASAVARVFAVKGRPHDHPLIVHLADTSAMDEWACDIPADARLAAAAFWPGPLSLVLQRRNDVGSAAAGGLATIALRCPDHPVALALLRAVDGGIAAPSANRFGRVSPTSAAHVLVELGDRLDPARDRILDGGAAHVGVESTILDLSSGLPRVLRLGSVSADDLSGVLGVDILLPAAASDADAPRVPGSLAAHYAPTARVRTVDSAAALAAVAREASGHVGVIAPAEVATPPGSMRLAAPTGVVDYARTLYAALRASDEQHLGTVVALLPATDAGGLADAVRDRLARAAVGSRPDDRR